MVIKAFFSEVFGGTGGGRPEGVTYGFLSFKRAGGDITSPWRPFGWICFEGGFGRGVSGVATPVPVAVPEAP